ncbi:MAG: PDC sensor domain-containing protein, partial [Candidatus Omnitrophica bacterium]|nr:PDC sensor domain-containing protein [Candidatus Omnitrophota bacterium]
DEAKYDHVGVGEKYANRQWFIEPLKDGKIHVSDFYTSRITNALCITVSGPIRNNLGEIKGILGFDLRIEELMRSDTENL